MTEQEIKQQMIMDLLGIDEYEVKHAPIWLFEVSERLYYKGWRKSE